MADAPDRDKGKRIGKGWLALTALVFIATAIVQFYFRTPKDRRPRKPIGDILRQIEHGDEVERSANIRGLLWELRQPAEFAQVFPYLIQAMKDESEIVRDAAASVVGGFLLPFGRNTPGSNETVATILALCPKAEAALAVLLDESSPTLRASAARSLGSVAAIAKLDAPPPRLVACLDDEAEPVREAATIALVKYSQGPELLVPVALRRLPTEGRRVFQDFERVFAHIRLEPSVLPLLIEGLSSENTDVCSSCTTAINHMGRDARPALPAILTLLRKELERPHVPETSSTLDIIAMASGAIGEISTDTVPLPGAVELLCEVLKRPGETRPVSDPNPPVSRVASGQASNYRGEFRQAEAAWSLGILGRAAAPAVPLLISTFEAAPEGSDQLRGIIAEALVEITRGTRDEDRVIASLARAWTTAPPEQKTVLARALRSLGPKSEQLVPELRQLPHDGTRTQIRRARYPRSDHEMPVRE
jgi:HEAT repeat protein